MSAIDPLSLLDGPYHLLARHAAHAEHVLGALDPDLAARARHAALTTSLPLDWWATQATRLIADGRSPEFVRDAIGWSQANGGHPSPCAVASFIDAMPLVIGAIADIGPVIAQAFAGIGEAITAVARDVNAALTRWGFYATPVRYGRKRRRPRRRRPVHGPGPVCRGWVK